MSLDIRSGSSFALKFRFQESAIIKMVDYSSEPCPMKMFVKTLDGNVLTTQVDARDPILVIKQFIQKETGVPVDKQRLIFAGKVLGSGRTFADYCIQKESTLHLLPELKGGSETVSYNSSKPDSDNWKPLSTEIYKFKEEFLDPRLRELLRTTIDAQSNLIRKEFDDVYSFPAISEQFCDKIIEEIEAYRTKTKDNGVALRLKEIGLDGMIRTMIESHLSPLLESLYPQLSGIRYDIYPKLMTYEMENNEDWPIHRDGDIATLNICLSKDFKGTDLRIYSKNNENQFIDYKHEKGRMVVVTGDNRHSVTQLESGKRYSLIIKINPYGNNY